MWVIRYPALILPIVIYLYGIDGIICMNVVTASYGNATLTFVVIFCHFSREATKLLVINFFFQRSDSKIMKLSKLWCDKVSRLSTKTTFLKRIPIDLQTIKDAE